MCCECCSEKQRKIWVYGLGTFFATLGTVLLIIWSDLALKLMHNSLILKEGTEGYNNWIEAPIPIYLEFHLFNWTNPQEIRNPNVKPHFVEMGPYVFLEKHFKQNLTFYQNDTVSYYEKRTWFFDARRSNGTLDDMVTAAHVITATVADTTRHRNKFIKKVVNFMLNHEGGEMYTTQRAGDWIFDGYQDRLIDFLKLFNTTKIDMPYKRFGWMVDRNASAEYDGLFLIHTGVDDVMNLGLLTHWNGKWNTGFYSPPCDIVNGTVGDIFPPHLNPDQELTIYATDACRFMNLSPTDTVEHYGVKGISWAGTNETLDSGENYPIQKCFCNPKEEECPKTGVIECRKCRNNAPIYASFPHFYLADESYVNAVSGIEPDEEKHKFTLAVEPFTGIPLQVKARLQINMMIQPDNDYDIYRNVNKVLMPMFWFEQKAELDSKLASRAKMAINLKDYGRYTGVALITIGCLFYLAALILTVTKRWKRIPADDEDMLTT